MLNIALPKGRLGEKAYKLLEDIGYKCEEFDSGKRKLVFTDKKNGVSYFGSSPRTSPSTSSAAPRTWAWSERTYCSNKARTSMNSKI